jgi:hypothetical protein
MKTKYTNFKHWASSAPEPTFVPEHLIRKHWSLQFIEFFHIAICIVIGISSYLACTNGPFFYAAAFIVIFLAFCCAVYLSINDDYRFRAATLSAHAFAALFSCIAFTFTRMHLALFITLLVPSILVSIALFSLKKNREYYEWCKSIAGKI